MLLVYNCAVAKGVICTFQGFVTLKKFQISVFLVNLIINLQLFKNYLVIL